ncbi:MAG: helix-turn-helix domain-containing protein [Phycisphaerales bacterium]|nr:helix-turn-helix domain-containing protein [Phycisphaerales bacterium]
MGNPIGELVKRLRKERELTLRQLADRMGEGYSHANISAKEVGRIGIKPNERKDFARAFGLTAEQFDAMWKGSPEQSAQPSDRGIPVLNSAPAAGRVFAYDSVNFDQPDLSSRFIPRAGIHDEASYVITVIGEEMAPAFRDGDDVVFGPVAAHHHQRYRIVANDVVLIRYRGETNATRTVIARIVQAKEKSIEIRFDLATSRAELIPRDRLLHVALGIQLRRSKL